MKTLRKGLRDKRGENEVTQWQYFLRGTLNEIGVPLYTGQVDGDFGPKTHEATKAFQSMHRLPADGIVGRLTYGKAFAFGFDPLEDTDADKYGKNWPPKPDFKSITLARKKKLFGDFDYKPAPTKYNPEGIKILGNWTKENIVKIHIPELVHVYGAPKSCKIFWHAKGADQIKGMFRAWDEAGLMSKVHSWAGSWVPRYIRGSRTTLSNHSWATAFDINVPWNGLGRQPALVGKKGSVRELVPIANEFGFYWGGHFTRKDGMHFEIAKTL